MFKGKGYYEVYCVFYFVYIFNNRYGLEIGKYYLNILQFQLRYILVIRYVQINGMYVSKNFDRL